MVGLEHNHERVYYRLHAEPYTPAARFPRKQADPEFRTKLQIAGDLIAEALAAGAFCRAVVADSFYGEHDALRGQLSPSGAGFRHGTQTISRHLAVRR
jgi:SRSO17 transposase